jgi:sialidase-1
MNKISVFYFSFLLILMNCVAEEESSLSLKDVFVGGQEGFPVYRIPALITTRKGTLLAFAEGRQSLNDQSKNQIVLKRSTDSGASWQALQVIAQDGVNSLNNPQAVIVGTTGRIILMYQRYPPTHSESKVATGVTGTNICTSWIMYSDDDGVTWTKPCDNTAEVKRSTATSLASGPGIGVELRRGPNAGRLIMPFNEGPAGKWRVYAAFSDDRGTTWKIGEPAPNNEKGYGNEVQMVELNDGSVMLNARNQGGNKLRKVAVSRDGGITWSPLKDDPNLPEPVCQASLIRHPNTGVPEKDVFLFSNPATQNGRTNGVVRLSRDEGATWPVSRIICPGTFAYSCLASLPDGSVGLIFEGSRKRIVFCRFTLDWLAAGAAK